MPNSERRQPVRLWLARWLLPLGLCLWAPALGLAQGQYEAAVEAMTPAAIAGPVLTNRIVRPDFARIAAPADKQRLRATLQVAAQPEPVPPTGPATPPAGTPSPTPPPGPNAVQPPPGATREKPLPLENPDEVRLKADDVRYTAGETEGRGNLEVRYQDLTIHSFVGRLDKDRVWGSFSGEVKLEAKLYDVNADELRINLDTEEFSARGAAAAVDPEYFEGQVEAPIYVHATELVGRPNRVVADEGTGTSCDLWPDPHWALRSTHITVVPDNRVTFHRPELYLFGNRLFRYPWDLTLSLRQRDNRFLPEVGQNSVEGYYAKFAFGYSLNDENTGFIRLNLTQKRGIGVGFDHTLDAGEQYAEFSVFTEPAQGSFTGRVLHRGKYSDALTSNLSLSIQDNSGYGYSSQSLSGDLTVRYDTREAHTSLGLQHSAMTSGTSTSERYSSAFSHRQSIGALGEWEVRTSYRNSSYTTTQVADQELETQLTWRQDFRTFAANLTASRRFDLDAGRYTGDDSYFSLNRLPDLTLTTDSARLGGAHFLGNRFNASIYLGYFDQQPDDIQSYRTGYEFSLPGLTREFGKVASLRTSARLRQLFYTGAAQWSFDSQTEYRLNLPGSWQTRLSFNYSHPEGFAPIRTDYASPAASLYFEAVRLVANRMRLNFTCGRDIENSTYNDAIVRGEFLLSPRDRIELQTGYSIENSQFRPLNLRWTFATERSWWSALTVNYDLDDTDLTNLSLDVDWNPSRLWRVQFLGGYTTYGGLDQADVRVTRDLHCMLAQFSYSHATSEFRIGLGIKAFPSDTRTFGVSGRGQYFESNFGDTY